MLPRRLKNCRPSAEKKDTLARMLPWSLPARSDVRLKSVVVALPLTKRCAPRLQLVAARVEHKPKETVSKGDAVMAIITTRIQTIG